MSGSPQRREFRASDFGPASSATGLAHRLTVFASILIVIVIVVLIYSAISVADNFKIQTTQFDTQGQFSAPLNIAFLTDLHVRNSTDQFEKLNSIIESVRKLEPDLILLGGDFTCEDTATTRMFRAELLTALGALPKVAPTYAILGNHEWWTASDWGTAITGVGIQLIEDQQRSLNFEQGRICLRGLGDAYTGHYQPQPFIPTCTGIPVTLTHDPLAIESDDQSGLYLAGHTHCGQIRLPLIGAPWAPTRASEEYHCGVGSTDKKVWLVSAGLGTSIIPFRFGTDAAIEHVILK